MVDPYASDAASSSPESTISLSRVFHILARYRYAITLAVMAVALAGTILALTAYTLSPTQRLTTQTFRLEFDGAKEGKFPNGREFSPSEIVATPILLRVYKRNSLGRFTSFTEFSRGLYVLQANAEYDRISAEYAARLADLRLAPADRERIQKEWEGRSAAMAKNEYSINYQRSSRLRAVPEAIVRKVMADVLSEWAAFAVKEQRVVQYSLDVLSPAVLSQATAPSAEQIVAAAVLRTKIKRIVANVEELAAVPGAAVLRTKSDGRLSLREISLRLDELVRFRIEPLVRSLAASGASADHGAAVSFLEDQLAFDERQLKQVESAAERIRESLALYTQNTRPSPLQNVTSRPTKGGEQVQSGETIMPQLDDKFIDRLLGMTEAANAPEYRRRMVESLRRVSAGTFPLRDAIAYDREVLAAVRQPSGVPHDFKQVESELETVRSEAHRLLAQVREIHDLLQHGRNAAREVYTLTAPPITNVTQPQSLKRLGLMAVFVTLLTIPFFIALAFVHAKLREEETDELLH